MPRSERNYFFWKNCFFQLFGTLDENFSAFCRNFLLKSCQNCSFHVSSGTFWSKLFFRKIRIFTINFGQLTKKFRLFVGFLFCRVVKATFYLSRETLNKKNIFLSKYIFSVSSDIERIVLAFWRNFSQKMSKLLSTCPEKHSEESKTFLLFKVWYFFTIFGHRRKNSGFKKKFGQGCQNCILTVQKSFLTQINFWRKNHTSFVNFGHRWKDFNPLTDFILQGFQSCILRVRRKILR